MLAERAARVEGAEQATVLEQRDRAVDQPFQIAARFDGGEVEAVGGAVLVPGGDQVGEVDGAAPVERALRGLPGAASAMAGFGGVLAVPEVDQQTHQDEQGVRVPPRCGRVGPQPVAEGAGLRGARRADEGHVGVASHGGPGRSLGGVDHAHRVSLRRSGRQGGAPHRERLAGEVDVVQLVAVQETAGRCVAYGGAVLPAVPQPRRHVGHFTGLLPQRVQRRGVPAAEEPGLPSVVETSIRQPARPRLTRSSVATVAWMWKGSVWVVVRVGTSPTRWVAGATRDNTADASGPGRAKVSSSVTKSSPPRSASRASST